MLPSTVRQEMIRDCLSRRPKEACGFLIANAAGMIERAQPMTNVENSAIGYSMDPREQLKLDKELRQRQQRIIGIYHSHTASAAYPSSVDTQLAIAPDISYVVVSTMNVAQPEVKSYFISGQHVIPQPIRDMTRSDVC